jgi:WD40-like Beta Propeller Repeat
MRRAVATIAISFGFGGCAWVERASIPTGHPVTPGIEANNSSSRPTVSDGGRFVALESSATDLVVDDTNNATDVFVRDLENDTTERVSVANGGAQSPSGGIEPSISDDGRYVAFVSHAQLTADDDDLAADVYVRDRLLATTTLRSNAFDPLPAPYPTTITGSPVAGPTLSGDGSTLAFNVAISFQSVNVTVGPFVTTGGSARLMTQGRLFPTRPSLSDDGSLVAWTSYSVIGTDAEMQSVIASTESNTLIASVDGGFVSHQSQGNFTIELSGNGQFAVTTRTARSNGDLFRYDVALEKLEPVATDLGFVQQTSISDDGERITVNAYLGATQALWMFEPDTLHSPRALSTGPLGNLANSLNDGLVSGDGRWAVFTTIDPSIAPFDDNPYADVFVRSIDVTTTGPS